MSGRQITTLARRPIPTRSPDLVDRLRFIDALLSLPSFPLE